MTEPEPATPPALAAWTCPTCREPMLSKFRRSHAAICAWATHNEAAAVTGLLHDLGLQAEASTAEACS